MLLEECCWHAVGWGLTKKGSSDVWDLGRECATDQHFLLPQFSTLLWWQTLSEGLYSQAFIGLGLKVFFSTKLLKFFLPSFRKRCVLLGCFFLEETDNTYSCASLKQELHHLKWRAITHPQWAFFCDPSHILPMLICRWVLKERKKAKNVLALLQKLLKLTVKETDILNMDGYLILQSYC